MVELAAMITARTNLPKSTTAWPGAVDLTMITYQAFSATFTQQGQATDPRHYPALLLRRSTFLIHHRIVHHRAWPRILRACQRQLLEGRASQFRGFPSRTFRALRLSRLQHRIRKEQTHIIDPNNSQISAILCAHWRILSDDTRKNDKPTIGRLYATFILTTSESTARRFVGIFVGHSTILYCYRLRFSRLRWDEEDR